VKEQEILANATKTLRIVLKDDQHLETIFKAHPDVGKIICQVLEEYSHSIPVTQEAAVCLKFYTREIEQVNSLDKDCIGSMINVHQDTKHDK